MAERLALVANPAAGGGADPTALAGRLRGLGVRVETYAIEDAGLAAGAAPDRLVVAGGDGTVGPAAAAAGEAGVPLAVLAVGTANDFARRMGLPLDLDEACRLAVAGAGRRPVDLARAGDRPFVNVANAGLAVRAAREAAAWKRPLGSLAYAVGAAVAAVRAAPVRCRVRVDGDEVFAGGAWQVMISNSGAFGAGATIAEADPGDGRLEATVIPAGRRAALALHGLALRRGSAGSRRDVVQRRGRAAEVDVASGTAFTLDGEVTALGSARFAVTPAAFMLVTP